MPAAVIIAMMSLVKEGMLAYMEMQGKDSITKDDLMTQSPEQLLAMMGIDLSK